MRGYLFPTIEGGYFYFCMTVQKDRFFLTLNTVPEGEFSEQFILDGGFLAQENPFDILGGEVTIFVEGLRTGDDFQLAFIVEGEVKTICDRCNTPFLLEVSNEFPLSVRLVNAESSQDNDEEFLVSRNEPILALDELLFEFVVLSMPMRKVHPEGECVAEAEEFFLSQTQEKEDPRWSVLKQLGENIGEKERD